MEYIQEITLDLNTHSAPLIINAKQNDVDSRILLVHFTKDGVEYQINNNNSVAIRIRKPDMHLIFDDGIIQDGAVKVTLTRQCLTTSGRAYADLVEFSNDGKMLSTTSFIINIQPYPDVIGNEAISSDEFLYLKSFIDKGNKVIGNAQEWAIGYNGDKEMEESGSIPDQPGSKNNAKYWSEQSNKWANGQTTGTPTSTNNAKYWADKAEENINNAVTEITTDFNTQKSNIISDFNTIINSINFSIQTDMTKDDRGKLYFSIDTID